MAPLMIEGNTLKEKHRSYNKIVNDTITNNSFQQITEINYEESDLDNLFKIDIASHNRNVEYILTVLKGQDMLYISRAIKQATWLITDPQYTQIINPNYLFNELFPQMTSKAINKLVLHIRLNLKDEQRVEEFFNYYKEKDLKTGFKWLPHCSNTFIENIVEKHANEIPNQLLKRLCEKSITFLDIFLKNYSYYYKYDALKSTLFLLRYDAELYIDIVERNNVIESLPALGPKFTKILMDKCGDKVKQNLDKFCQFIHVPTFAKYIKKEEVKEIILKNFRNPRMRNWFSHINIKHFVNRLPAEERFELIKEIFIEKKYQDDGNLHDDIVPRHAYRSGGKISSENIYCWYTYASFNVASTDLKKMIRSESNPSDRIGMFGVMLTCAKNNMQNLQTLLKYYRENHINESYKFKSQFVNLVVTRTHTHRYDKTTWGYLNDLFVSMEVYTESNKNVQSCLKSIVLYNIVNDQSVPEAVEKNFTFDTFKKYYVKFTQEERDKVFSYLFNYINLKLNNNIKNNEQLTEAVEVLKNILQLLEDWGKELHDYPTIVEKIKDIVNIKRTNKSWDCDLTKLYSIPKSWKKLLFAESILLNPNQEACINALKHGPHVLETCKEEVEALCVSDKVLAERFLKKIRIYWSQSLANDFKTLFMKKMDQSNNHKAVIIGLCTLLPQQEFISLVQKYIPNEEKIDWNQHDERELSACKHIASSLHVARPQPSLDIALSFAKGDYLQYILPSLSAILYNISCETGRRYVTRLIDAPVSLKKHGIRFSFKKLQHNELKLLYSDVWKSNKNSIIRSDIFTQTYNMLCNEKDPVRIKDIWQLLSMFIDNLSSEENKNIYSKLGKVDKVPLSVRPQYLMKSYRFLKSLPPKANSRDYVNLLITEIKSMVELLDDDFLQDVFMESFDKQFSTQVYGNPHLIAASVLSCKTADEQMRRYNKIFVPILDRALAMWDTTHNNNYFVRYNLYRIFKSMSQEFTDIVLQNEMMFPTAIFRDLLERINNSIVLHENYYLITKAKLTFNYIQILEEICEARKDIVTEIKSKKCNEYETDDKWEPLHDEAATKFGEICLKHLKEDVANNFPSIYEGFTDALNDVFQELDIRLVVQSKSLKWFLDDKDFIPGYLLILKLLPNNFYHSNEKAVGLELLNIIKSHPSKEINMHYWRHLKDKFLYLN